MTSAITTTTNAGSAPTDPTAGSATRTAYLVLKISAAGKNRSHGGGGGYIPVRTLAVLGHEWQIDYTPDGFHNPPTARSDGQRWLKLRLRLIRAAAAMAGGAAANDAAFFVRASFTFRLVDPSQRLTLFPDVATRECSEFRPGSPTEVPLWPRPALDASGYLGRDGNCFVHCAVVVHERPNNPAPGADLRRDLGNLLTTTQGADVTFVVAGERVPAHRCVLGARSPVLKAELAGITSSSVIEVSDMDAGTFRALLHFIYTDALPPQLDEMEMAMARRLLDAADQYGVERLRAVCEEKACQGVNVGSVAADLAWAEKRGYARLRARCVEFLMARPRHFLEVAQAGGCKMLEAKCPWVLTELLTAIAESTLDGRHPRT